MQVDDIARQRFESFKLGMASATPAAPVAAPAHRHGRSHSRNASISSTISLPTPVSTTNAHDTHTNSLPAPSKRNSHHRRRSSVSTRRESAEMMGVPASDSSISTADEAAESRRNALFALEGKRDASFSKVEIPELAPFEFPTKPSFPPGSGAFVTKSQRDSFKLAPKDALHTLVEEEEEEDDGERARAPPTPTTPTSLFMRNITARPRPPHLRPLSLTPDSLPSYTVASPNEAVANKRSSLKVLALSPDASTVTSTAAAARPRPVLNLKMDASPTEETASRPVPLRKSSISYKVSTSNAAGLPTPESTPTTSERRFSTFSNASISSLSSASNEELGSRPLSASEQHFLFKSHNALLARITDLERALSFRNNNVRDRSSRSSSIASGLSGLSRSSSPEPEEPLDEMVSLVSDLKAERDELKRDVEGWRTRVADLEKQLTVFTNRVGVERREAWVARNQVGVLEVERNGLTKRVEELQTENDRLRCGEDDLKQQIARLLAEKEEMAAELRDAKSKREADPLSTPRAFDGPVVPIRPVPLNLKRGLGFTSLDSESSATDVEDSLLDAVAEEDDELAGYEDEDENDVLLSPSSSFGSLEDFHPAVDATPQSASSVPAHVPRLSISKWTFPKHVSKNESTEPEVDRFFGCLDDLDGPVSPDCPNYADYDEEMSKGLFSKGFSFGDTTSCFVLPADVIANAEASYVLDSVDEEDETEGETVVEDGEINNGIKITFTPPMEDVVAPVSVPSPSPKPVPTIFFEEEEDEEAPPAKPFSFGRSPQTPPSTMAARHETPSSIPRLVSKSPASPPATRSISPLNNSFVTPPNKRGGALPSFIPQPSSPSSRITTPPSFSSNASSKPSTTTFIRQPPRQPLMATRDSSKVAHSNGSAIPRLSHLTQLPMRCCIDIADCGCLFLFHVSDVFSPCGASLFAYELHPLLGYDLASQCTERCCWARLEACGCAGRTDQARVCFEAEPVGAAQVAAGTRDDGERSGVDDVEEERRGGGIFMMYHTSGLGLILPTSVTSFAADTQTSPGQTTSALLRLFSRPPLSFCILCCIYASRILALPLARTNRLFLTHTVPTTTSCCCFNALFIHFSSPRDILFVSNMSSIAAAISHAVAFLIRPLLANAAALSMGAKPASFSTQHITSAHVALTTALVSTVKGNRGIATLVLTASAPPAGIESTGIAWKEWFKALTRCAGDKDAQQVLLFLGPGYAKVRVGAGKVVDVWVPTRHFAMPIIAPKTAAAPVQKTPTTAQLRTALLSAQLRSRGRATPSQRRVALPNGRVHVPSPLRTFSLPVEDEDDAESTTDDSDSECDFDFSDAESDASSMSSAPSSPPLSPVKTKFEVAAKPAVYMHPAARARAAAAALVNKAQLQLRATRPCPRPVGPRTRAVPAAVPSRARTTAYIYAGGVTKVMTGGVMLGPRVEL
uniref:Uncharacterized protein n=1 Tax=Mycena chlorophos TaxID=658473 RepID=A0ABQ0LRZ2_MYCCL|nr:predicted protein [Mycena chlorophos]